MSVSKLILFLPLIVLFTSTAPNDANAEEVLGSILVDIRYDSNDRIDTYQTVLKIYQDENQIPYRIIEFPEKNPILIDSLPTNHEYKIDVYVTGMQIDSAFGSVGNDVIFHIPESGGIKFKITYDDGKSPIAGAELRIKSDDGYVWQQDIVGANGESKRFWMQSNNLIDEYYLAEIIVDQSLTYTSPQHIKFFPGSQGEITIKTPWPRIIDKTIIISAYNNTSNKVTKQDGDFLVEIYDSKNNKIDQKQVDFRGDSFFSNLKVGQYTFKIIKQTTTSNEVFAATKRILSGDESEIKIFREELSTNLQKNSCNCVAFRLDDVQDYYLQTPQMEVMSTFQKKQAPLTLGIIGGFWGNDQTILNFVKQDISKSTPLFEIGSHSWNNSPLTNYDKEGQRELIQKSKDVIEKTLNVTPTSFIAVENLFNNDTKAVLQELNFTHFTAHIAVENAPSYPRENSKLYYFPASTQTGILNPDTNLWKNVDNEITFSEAKNFLNQYGFAVIMMHPYEFAETDLGVYTGNSKQAAIEKLGELIDEFRINGIEIVTLNGITEIPVEKIDIVEESVPEISPDDEFQSCNCVAFRFVTIQDYWLNDVQTRIIDTFIQNNAGLTVGIIGELFGNDAKLTNYLKNKVSGNNNIEIANNGWSYKSFSDLTEIEQNNQLKQSNEHLTKIFGETPSVFIPPYDIFNEDTITSMKANNMNHISSNIKNDPPPYNSKSEIHHFPASSSTGIFATGFNLIQSVDNEKILKNIQTNLDSDGFAVVTLSPQEFSETENDKYVNQINEKQIHELELLLEKIQTQGLEIVPIGKIDSLFATKIVKDSEKDIAEHCNQLLAPNVDLSGCDLKNQLIEEIQLGNSNLKNIDLRGTTIRNTDLRNATITDGDLRRAQISGVSLAAGKLSNSDLSNAHLQETDLRGTDFQGATIRYANFVNSDASGASFSKADLSGSKFRGVGVSKVNLTNTDLTETDFSGVNLGESILNNANLSGANLTGASFIKSQLVKSKLIGADLTNANFKDANLSGADLTGAILKDINLSNANLTEIDISGADLTKVILKGVDLSNANLQKTNLKNSELIGANLSGVNLSGADLSKANLSEIQIKNAKITDANLSGVNLSGVDLSGVDLSGVNLSSSNLNGTNMSGADLTKVILKGVDLSNSDLTNANLSGADLTGADLSGSDLTGADLTNANLSGVDLTEADLTDINLNGADFSGADLTNTVIKQKDLDNAKSDDKTILPERGFFFFRELFEFFKSLFNWS